MTTPGSSMKPVEQIDKESAEEMLSNLREVVPQRTVAGRHLDPFRDPRPGEVYITPQGERIVVPPKPSSRDLSEDQGYYWDWYALKWVLFGPTLGYPFWWPYRLWWWQTFYPGYFSIWNPWLFGYRRWWGGRRRRRYRPFFGPFGFGGRRRIRRGRRPWRRRIRRRRHRPLLGPRRGMRGRPFRGMRRRGGGGGRRRGGGGRRR